MNERKETFDRSRELGAAAAIDAVQLVGPRHPVRCNVPAETARAGNLLRARKHPGHEIGLRSRPGKGPPGHPDFSLQLVPGAAHLLHEAPLLGCHGCHGQGRDAADTEEPLEKKERLVQLCGREGGPPAGRPHQGRGNGGAGKEQVGKGGLAAAEAESGPQEQRDAQEMDGRGREGGNPEEGPADDNDAQGQRSALQHPFRRPTSCRAPRVSRNEKHYHRCNQDVSHRVSQPPRQPDLAEVRGPGVAAPREHADSDGCAESGGGQSGEQHEAEDCGHAFKYVPAACQALHENGAHKALADVARCDDQGRCNGAPRGHVGRERPKEERGGHPPAQEEDHGEGKTRRRPHGRCAGIDQRKAEPQLGAGKVKERDSP